MGTFYKDILWRAFRDLPRLVGYTWLGLVISLFIFLAVFFAKLRVQTNWKTTRNWREKLTAMREHWQRDAKIATVAVLVAWTGLYLVSLAKAIYQEHNAAEEKVLELSQVTRTLREENSAIKNQSGANQAKKGRTAHSPIAVPTVKESWMRAPNGIAIGENNFGAPTVNNTFSDAYPRPGVIPRVTFYPFASQQSGAEYFTLIKVRTDTEISAPFWGLVFNRPVIDAKIAIKGISEPFGWSDGHPFKSGLSMEPLDTLPSDSRIILGEEGHERISSDRVLRVQVTEIGSPFGGPYRPWGPKDLLTITVRSNQKIKLVGIVSGSKRTFLPERILVSSP